MSPASLIETTIPQMSKRLITVGLLLACLAGFLGNVHANEIPWRAEPVDLTATNEPLAPFIIRLLTRQRISAAVSEAVGTEAINGRFRGRPDVVFREIAETYGLTWYYDGAVLHVTSLAENRTRLIGVDPTLASRADKMLRDMGIVDRRYPVRLSPSEGYLLVSGPPRMVELVMEAVRLMSETPSVTVQNAARVFRLKHAWADDRKVSVAGVETTMPGVARLLNEMLGDRSRSAARSRELPKRQAGLRGTGLAAVGQPETTAPAAGSASASVGSSPAAASGAAPSAAQSAAIGSARFGSSRGAAPGTTDGTTDEVIYTGQAIVRADPRLNAVIVRDSPERMPIYEELIASLDQPSSLVEVEATVVDVSTDTSQTLGIDWRAHSSRVDIASSPNNLAGTAQGDRNIANNLLFTDNPLSAGSGFIGTLLFGSQRSYFLARINALSQDGQANVVSRPRVLTLDNNEAVLQSTQEFYVRVQGKDTVDLYNISVGLVLRVTPTVIEQDGVRKFKLLVRIEDGNQSSSAQNGVDQIPLVSRNSIVTQALIGEGESLLIGGYVIEEARKGESGVPYLSKLPGIGMLFRQDSSSSRRFERMFMITPRLVTRQGASP
jgi:type III secretion protein C